jgi:hypothetical protein
MGIHDHRSAREDLAQADRDIAEGAKRMADHCLLIEWMVTAGQDTTEAKKLLQSYERTLAQWRRDRDLLRYKIECLESG